MFFLPKATQNSSLSLSFYNLNITGDYRHLSFPFISQVSLPRLIQVILYPSSSHPPGPSFPNPPDLIFCSNRSSRKPDNRSKQVRLCYLPWISGYGLAKLNLLPSFKLHLFYNVKDLFINKRRIRKNCVTWRMDCLLYTSPSPRDS